MIRTLSIFLTALITIACSPAFADRPIPIEVKVKIVDAKDKPVSDVPVRVVFACDKDWQNPDTGHKVLTDANGEGTFTANVVLTKQMRKRPTNFMDKIVHIPQQAQELSVGAEMEYMNHPLLYTMDVVSFIGGDSILDGFSIYSADKKGRFTRRTEQNNDGWNIKTVDGAVLTSPGYEPAKYSLHPDADGHWTLRMAFKSLPSPAVH